MGSRFRTIPALVGIALTAPWALHADAATTSGLVAVGEPFVVGTYTTSGNYAPSVVAAPGGGFLVVWSSERPIPPYVWRTTTIQARRFDSMARPLAEEVAVAGSYQNSGSLFTTTDVAAFSDGFVVVWSSSDFGNDALLVDHDDIWARRLDLAGTPLGADLLVSTPRAGYDLYPRVSAAEDGEFVVVWDAGGGDTNPEFRVFDRDDLPLTPALPVEEGPQAHHAEDADVAMSPGGAFVVRWNTNAGAELPPVSECEGLVRRRFDTSGAALEAPSPLAVLDGYCVYGERGSIVANRQNQAASVWWGWPGGIHGWIGDPSGTPPQRWFTVGGSDNGHYPDLAPIPTGGFVVSWTDFDDGFFVNSVDSRGVTESEPFEVSPDGECCQFGSRVAADENGSVLVVWSKWKGNGYDEVRARLFRLACGDGTLASPEQCDDENYESGDGCSPSCRSERCGDVDESGSVTIVDALALLQRTLGRPCALTVCDVDGDGDVDSTDALGVLKFSVGQPVGLACPTVTTALSR